MAETFGNILSGTAVAADIRQKLAADVREIQQKHPDFKPGLVVVQVGDMEDSNVYIRQKVKAAAEVGVDAKHMKLSRATTQIELVNILHELNENPAVHGIIVQLPLDSEETIDAGLITNTVAASKDVDGLNQLNKGRLADGELEKCIIPCTPRGCLELIKRTGVSVSGSRAVVLGRSKIVGAPMASLLMWNHATVTTCHSRTKDMKDVVGEADILVVAIRQPQMVKGDWVKPGAVVIDCGINAIPDASKKSGQRLVGDVDFDQVKSVASYITPVPGGVGPLTVAMLIQNTVDAAKKTLTY